MKTKDSAAAALAKGVRRLSLLLIISAGVYGCGGGDGIDIADGQDADPVLVDIPVAYVRRSVPQVDPQDPASSELTRLTAPEPGAVLLVRDRASSTAPEVQITGGANYDIRDLSASHDGKTLLFAMRGPILPGVDEDDLPSWNIWSYEFETTSLQRLISDDSDAEAGHDRFPAFLPDGRVVFSSTRQVQSSEVLIDEGKGSFTLFEESENEPAFLLHVMSADGEEIQQISFNRSHDMYPTVVSNGQIVFVRWDQAPGYDQLNLYRVNPDGTAMELLYGANSHFTGSGGNYIEFTQPRELPDGRLLSVIRPRAGTNNGGQIVAIDIANYVENGQGTNGGVGGSAQQTVTTNVVNTEPGVSDGGRYSTVFPLWDGTGRALVSWTQCQVYDNANQIQPCSLAGSSVNEAPAAYGIWLYNLVENTQVPIVPPQQGVWYTEIVAAEPRQAPALIFNSTGSASAYPGLAADGWGILNIRSVYDIDGADTAVPDIATLADPLAVSPDLRAARFLRVVKPASIPDEDTLDVPRFAFGITTFFGMREIVGYSKIEPDGSVRMRVPANVPLAVEVLDANGRRLANSGHSNWLQVMPGSEVTCNGCHDASSGLSHGRSNAFPSVYPGATASQFRNTSGALLSLIGETMAETRTRISCANDNCASLDGSIDIEYQDDWTPPAATPAATFAYSYDELETPVPVSGPCLADWSSACRIVVNYEEHIHPLWYLSRTEVDDSDEDRQCSSCHVPAVNPDTNLLEDAPAYLDLGDGVSGDNQNLMKAYLELLAGDFRQEDDGAGGLTDVLVDTGELDEFDQPIFVRVPVSRSLIPGNARGSGRFFSKFATGGSHEGWLSPAELKLLSEWVDIGAQYYNNPFDVPQN